MIKRRDFLKTVGTSGVVLLVNPWGVVHTFGQDGKVNLKRGFNLPPSSARPGTFYLFMNGHISKSGITRDLEAWRKIGLGGIMNYNAGIAIPKGPVDYFSDEWYSLLKHTVQESERLGLEYAMHNCPGWSSSGGPWVTPEHAMQKVVWTETIINGGKNQTSSAFSQTRLL